MEGGGGVTLASVKGFSIKTMHGNNMGNHSALFLIIKIISSKAFSGYEWINAFLSFFLSFFLFLTEIFFYIVVNIIKVS